MGASFVGGKMEASGIFGGVVCTDFRRRYSMLFEYLRGKNLHSNHIILNLHI